MDLAIIGLGAFGSWLVDQYVNLGLKIKVYDIDLEKIKRLESNRVVGCRELRETVHDVEVVIVSVPISNAAQVIIEVSRYMERGAVVDVSSLKKPVYNTLRSLPERLNPVCIHPLFGPNTSGFKDKRVAIIPIRNYLKELEISEKLMPGAEFVKVSVDEHDKAMAYILSTTHLLSLSIVGLLKDVEREDMGELAGTSFKHMCKMVDLVLRESRETLTSILYYNEDTEKISQRILESLYQLYEVIRRRDYEELKRYIDELKGEYSKLNFLKRY
ncbi:MAG: prephenate dehydrogenase [Aigarchaeota archaeon]|nr:prephenate dehydrogenase [Aigarchaeota archaeon]MDW7986537.1 prephenate dehydrogenase [Nitrososphaerota archaeon]